MQNTLMFVSTLSTIIAQLPTLYARVGVPECEQRHTQIHRSADDESEIVVHMGEIHCGTNYQLYFDAYTGTLKGAHRLTWAASGEIHHTPISPF